MSYTDRTTPYIGWNIVYNSLTKGTNGDAVVTKYAELVVFPDTDFEVCAVHIPIRFCPFCSKPMK